MNARTSTHEVTNQSVPLAGANLFTGNRPLRDALAFHGLPMDDAALSSLGAISMATSAASFRSCGI